MKTLGNKVIYNTLEEIVDPEHTLLVAWDIQNALVNNIFNKNEFVENTGALLAAARKNNIPVVYTKITPLPPEFEFPSKIYMSMKRSGIEDPSKLPQFMKPGSPEAEIYTDLSPDPADAVLNKNTASLFTGTNFENMARARNIDTLIFTGISTEFGIASSARDSANRGFYTVIASDCVSSPYREGHEASLKAISPVAIVTSSAEIKSGWK